MGGCGGRDAGYARRPLAACAARAVSPGGQARAGGRTDVKLLIGFDRGENDRCIFYHPERDLLLLLYVDRVISNDFAIFVTFHVLGSPYGVHNPAQHGWLQPSYPLGKWVA